jgi:hypothetical protein
MRARVESDLRLHEHDRRTNRTTHRTRRLAPEAIRSPDGLSARAFFEIQTPGTLP